MQMRKVAVVFGIILLVVGIVFLALHFLYTPWHAGHNTTITLSPGDGHMYSVLGFETYKVRCEYNASGEVMFFVFNEDNYESFIDFWENKNLASHYLTIYYSNGTSDSYTFVAPRDDTYVMLLGRSSGKEGSVSVSVKMQNESRAYREMFYVGGIGFTVLGSVTLVGGLILKPKEKKASTVSPAHTL
jgi:hypothetical protein